MRRTLIVGALVLAVVADGTWIAKHRAAATTAKERLLVVPFENLTGDERFSGTGRVVADRLALRLAQAGTMDVVPSSTVILASRDTSRVASEWQRSLAAATHPSQLVTGTIVVRGNSLLLQAQLTDAKSGRTIGTIDPDPRPATDPIAAIDALGERLLGMLGLRDFGSLSVGGYRAPKNEAYQQFALGFEKFAVQEDNLGSRPFFARAIALDSTFARAYQLLLRQYLNAREFDRVNSLLRRMERLLNLGAGERAFVEYSRAQLRGDIAGMYRAQQQLVASDSNALSLQLTAEAAIW